MRKFWNADIVIIPPDDEQGSGEDSDDDESPNSNINHIPTIIEPESLYGENVMSKKILSPGDLEKSLQQVVRELEEEGSTIENQREEYCDIIDDEFYSDSDQEPEIIERNDYSSDSELSADEGEAEFEPREQEEDYQFFIGKDNKTLWISQPSSSGEMQAKNIIKILPGPKGNAKRAKTEIDAFNLYITDEMVDDIVANTNIYIENNKSSKMYSRERDSKNTTKSEIKALLDVDQDLRKSLVNFDYNSTKGGVDTVDQMCASYSVSRITRRWPLVVFFRHLEIAGINARVIFKFNNLDNKDERRVFLRKLALELMKDHLKERALTQSLPKDISYFLDKYRNEEGTERGEEVKTGICFICGTHKNNRTKQKCNKCARNICKKHSSTHITCTKCKEEEMEVE
ncbi:hypothetical protein HUJ05_004326 [Dendroctonus ponderosae]|nr:hypothetical protein HUJ05_004326 [Dendroctonus ponderosae]